MAVPNRKISKEKKIKRRSHHAIGKPNLVACTNCGTLIMPHRVCPECGNYKNKLVLQPKKVFIEL